MLVPSRSHSRIALLLLGACLLPSMARPQDLAAVAKKEKERRAKVTKPAKVLTEDDGKEAGAKGTGSVTALPGEGAAAPSSSERASAAMAADAQEASWKSRAVAVRQAVVTAEQKLAQMEKDVAAYRSDMAPVSAADAMDPMRLQKRDARIFEMNKQVEAQKVAVADAKKALTAFEDEARRAGVPAGWLR
jgi:hypothetical protein